MRRRGFSITELLLVVALIGLLVGIALPRLRPGDRQRVNAAAIQLSRDLELARTRAFGVRRMVRVTFDAAARRYAWVTDVNGDSLFAAPDSTLAGPGMFGERLLPDGVRFGRGGAPPLPRLTDTTTRAVSLDSARVVFDDRGLTFPAMTQGAVYLESAGASGTVAAVSISAAGAFRAWFFTGTAWQ